MYFKMRQSVSSYEMYYFKRAPHVCCCCKSLGLPVAPPPPAPGSEKDSGRKFTILAISLIYALRRVYVWKTVEREKKEDKCLVFT